MTYQSMFPEQARLVSVIDSAQHVLRQSLALSLCSAAVQDRRVCSAGALIRGTCSLNAILDSKESCVLKRAMAAWVTDLSVVNDGTGYALLKVSYRVADPSMIRPS